MSYLNDLSSKIIECCIKVHKNFGPGLFESVYHKVLCFELNKCGINFESEVFVPVVYEDLIIENAFRADLIVEKKVIVEIKAVENLTPIHKKQLLTYLKLSKLKLGLLINFNEHYLKNGIVRLVNGLEE